MKQPILSSQILPPTNDVSVWSSALTSVLGPELPEDLRQEVISSISESLAHESLSLRHSDTELSLSELESHPLTQLLQDQLSPYLDSDVISYSFLSNALIEELFSPRSVNSERENEKRREKEKGKKGCELCGRVMPLTSHHLIPRSTHAYFLSHPLQLSSITPLLTLVTSNTSTSTPMTHEHVSQRALKDGLGRYLASLCRPCHSQIHRLIPDHRDLGRDYNTVQKLLDREDVQKWVNYVAGQRVSDVRMGQGVRYRR